MHVFDDIAAQQRPAVLALNNAHAQETSWLSGQRLDALIQAAAITLYSPPAAGFLLAFEQSDDYDGANFLWFRERLPRFLYVDRVVVAQPFRRHGLGRLFYRELFRKAAAMRHTYVVCEINVSPPNPISDRFHDAFGFEEIGRATIDDGAKTGRYLSARVDEQPLHPILLRPDV